MKMKNLLLIAAGFIFFSGNTYASAESAFDDVTRHSDYNKIRHYYNLDKNRKGDGLPQKKEYRQVYPDVKDEKFNIYWGQSFDELSTDYELKWSAWSTNIAYYNLQLNKIYKKKAPYMILWFNEDKLYKIWMYYPLGLKESKYHRGRVVRDLTQKFGTPAVYNESMLIWEDTSVKVNSVEEQMLEKKFNYHISRHKK